jgi:hypothetical protein
LLPKQKAEEGQLEGALGVLLAGAHVPKGHLASTSLKRQAMLSILYQLGELQSTDESTLLAALAKAERVRESIVSVLLLGEHDLAEVVALQEEYGTVTFFVSTGTNVPPSQASPAKGEGVLTYPCQPLPEGEGEIGLVKLTSPLSSPLSRVA